MATLHVLSHSPFTDNRLASCQRLLGTHDALLLCGDAVYALLPGNALSGPLQQRKLALYALEEDVKARAIQAPAWVTVVDYPAFVQLSIDFDKVNTWL